MRHAPRSPGLVLALLTLLLVPHPGHAHASLVRSSPARRAVLLRVPDRVQLWFNERVEPQFSKLSVFGPHGQQVDLRDARVGADDRRAFSVGLPSSLSSGVYAVRFRVLSVDGHVVEGELSFTLQVP